MLHENDLQCEKHCISEKTFFFVCVWRICVVLLSADFPPPGIRYLPVGCWQLHGVPCKDIGPHHCNEHGHNSCKSKLPSWCSTITTSMHHTSIVLQFHHTTPVCNFCAVHCDCVMCAIHSDRGGGQHFYVLSHPASCLQNQPIFIWHLIQCKCCKHIYCSLCFVYNFCIPKNAVDYCIFQNMH